MNKSKIELWCIEWFKRRFGIGVFDYLESRFIPIIELYIKNKRTLLDAACGKRNRFLSSIDLAKMTTVGVDIDSSVLDNNIIHNNFIISDLHSIKTDLCFDIIISAYTLEHL